MRFRLLNHELSSIHAAAFLLGAAGLFSRLIGIVRDRLLASHFGAGRELDIYYAAFQIPDFLSVIFLLGAGSAAILPVFQEFLAKDRKRARELISQLTSFFLLSALGLAALAFVLAPWLARLAVPGFSPAERDLTVTLMRIMLCSPILFGLSAIFSAVVQSFQRFLAYALAPILYNLGIIIGILFFVPLWGVTGLAVGVALGAGMHLAVQYVSLASLGFLPGFTFRFSGTGMKKIFALSVPRVLSLSFTQLTVIVLTALASLLASGSISVFQFAQNLYFVPVGIFGVSYSVALFPRMTAAYIERSGERFFSEFFLGVRSILFWVLPSAVLFFVLRGDIVRVVLGGRAFSAADADLTAACLGVLSVAIIAASLMPHLVKSFYALENTRVPLVVDICGSIVSVALAFIFARLVAYSPDFARFLTGALAIPGAARPEVLGIALGFSLGLAANALFLYMVLIPFARRALGTDGYLPFLPVAKIAGASLLAGFAAYAARIPFAGFAPHSPIFAALAHGLLAGSVGMLVYLATLVILGSEDANVLRLNIRKRVFSLGILPKSWSGDRLG